MRQGNEPRNLSGVGTMRAMVGMIEEADGSQDFETLRTRQEIADWKKWAREEIKAGHYAALAIFTATDDGYGFWTPDTHTDPVWIVYR
jgi:hypothetical protein